MADVFRVRIDAAGSRELMNFMARFPQSFDKMNKVSLFRIGEELRGDAGKAAPYKTGTLRRSIQNVSGSNTAYKTAKIQHGRMVQVGTNLVYARRQEYENRTRKLFLTKAFEKQKDQRVSVVFNEEISHMLKSKR